MSALVRRGCGPLGARSIGNLANRSSGRGCCRAIFCLGCGNVVFPDLVSLVFISRAQVEGQRLQQQEGLSQRLAVFLWRVSRVSMMLTAV